MCKRQQFSTVSAIFIAFGVFLSISYAGPARFDGDKVVRVQVADEAQLDTVLSLTDDVWSHGYAAPGPIEFRVSPMQLAALGTLRIPYEVVVEDVQAALDAQMIPAGPDSFDRYLTWTEVRAHLATLEAAHPNIAQRVVIGQSIEGRPLEMLRITGPGDSSQRPVVWLQGCQHAREWISVMVPLYIADRLVNSYEGDPGLHALLDRAVVCIMPVVNPDGYEYTWTTFRLWRKSRRNNGDGSFGVDLNRNWEVGWGGVNSFPSGFSDGYRGTAPFSEPETRAIRDYLATVPELGGLIDYHSFSSLILLPWSYQAPRPERNEALTNNGRLMQRAAANVYGQPFTANQCFHLGTGFRAGGVSCDYGHSVDSALSVGIELRGGGPNGFDLPPAQILPSGEEMWPAALQLIRAASCGIEIDPVPTPPAYFKPGVANVVTARIQAPISSATVAAAELRYRIGGGETVVVSMSAGDCPNCFTAEIPAAPCGTSIAYQIVATRSDGLIARYPDPSLQTEAIVPVRVPQTITTFDFNSSAVGWAAASAFTSGRWARGTPRATFTPDGQAEPGGGYPGGSGGACWVTGISTTDDPEATDVDGDPTSLTSPLLNIGSLRDPVFEFAYWCFSSGHEGVMLDIASNQIVLRPIQGLGAFGDWRIAQIRPREWIGSGTSARLAFSVAGYTVSAITEAAIDDFQLLDLACPLLPGDMNCDAFVTVADIGGFVLALTDPAQYAAEYPNCEIARADVNVDAVVNANDIAAFVGLLTNR